jgi:hypothetical protein
MQSFGVHEMMGVLLLLVFLSSRAFAQNLPPGSVALEASPKMQLGPTAKPVSQVLAPNSQMSEGIVSP